MNYKKKKAISVLETNTAFKINALNTMLIIFTVIAKDMIKLLYFDTNTTGEQELLTLAEHLPIKMQEYVLRYRYVSDRKLSLVGRLMLFKVLQGEGKPYLIQDWEKGLNNKPFIIDWKEFNISHSGSMVAFCYGDNLVGVDIEVISDSNHLEFIDFLHPDEFHYISASKKPTDSFYNVWVRKEAFLKATGLGLTNQSAEYNCLPDIVSYNELLWHIKEIEINAAYKCCVCSLDNEEIDIEKFVLSF
ncbi:4'-phosphopantetheinyl transferase [Pedobacter psychrotolerans]|uniref:4'-phosphopantetheinyl transferase n=1 Tax=Pedobacter psychrotolerans TaxID=1843235 RepID=A0A4R2H2D5_9SPHI|nr:4'-phosphopantetheinyl transferase superfamily protein [Pedobacter psychrotolerans]TCO18754.1 4'-phosphopantetheinyl transferase [Pedobacter psychrotolerans]GGE70500.1 4'-phosphopantetheinyl transferase [Pedobacter psychrotolerans]